MIQERAVQVFAIVGIIASIVTLLQFIFPRIAEKFSVWFSDRSRQAWYSRGWKLGEIDDAIVKAEHVLILQTWIPTLNRDVAAWRNSKPSTEFRILLLDPSLALNRLACREHDQDLIEKNINILKTMRERNISVRQYKSLPFGPVYIVDNVIYWGVYTSDRCSMEGPMFKVDRRSWLGLKIESSVLRIWERAKIVHISDGAPL